MRCYLKYSILLVLLVVAACQKEETVSPIEKDQDQTDGGGTVKVIPNDFLSSQKYDKLVVEIQYVEGYQPNTESVNNLKNFLQQRLNKPGGITFLQKAIPSPGKTSYTFEDLNEVEKANRTQQAKDKTIAAYFFFADGDYAANNGNSKVLGIAYGGSSMVIFEKTIKEFSGGITQPAVSTLETTVIHHEFAHILGLVNNGTSMESPHQDEAHGRHCNEEGCLMYYTAETSDIVGNLIGGNIPQLDAKCLADLKANGGK